MTITTCRICNSKNLKPFFDLGAQPLANSLLSRADEPEQLYPLALTFCGDCNLVQLTETVDPNILFSNYVWVTGTSKGANEFSEKFYTELSSRAGAGDASRAGNAKSSYVLEIASNDGTFLKPFIKNGWQVLGVDPAENFVEMANHAGVPTKRAFWSKAAAEEVVREKGKAQVLFARNVLPHVANTRDFVEGLALALDDGGTLAIEAHYAKIILDELHYDSIYHEHLCYFTLKTLERLLHECGLFVFDVADSPISGGSMILYAKKTNITETVALRAFRAIEERERVNDLPRWEDFAKQAFAHREKLLSILRKAAALGKIVGWGASARSSTMLNFCGIDSRMLSSIIDLNPLMQGKFTAGTHIPIVPPEAAFRETPSMVFVTGWNFSGEIIEMLRGKFGYRGPCLIPLPHDPRVIS